MDQPIWTPSAERVANANLTGFIEHVRTIHGLALADYPSLHAWSVAEPGPFWSAVWDFCGVIGDRGEGPTVCDVEEMPGARWFPRAQLNIAETMLTRRDDFPALVALREDGLRRSVSFAELHAMVSRLALAMRAAGVGPGDRVAGYISNVPEAVAAMLATFSIGAIWCCVAPEYGAAAALDRLGQIEPKLLFSADAYLFNGKRHELLPRAAELSAAMPSLVATVIVPFLPEFAPVPGFIEYAHFVAPFAAGQITFARLPFEHPALILFSSGTTGAPKCIVHSAGGALIENLKAHSLHFDVKRGEKVYMACATGWVVWNIALFALALGATIVLYDGSPSWPQADQLVRHTAEERVTLVRYPARYMDGLAKAGADPARGHDLSAVRTIMVNGSVFGPDGYRYIYDKVAPGAHLISPAGGTDFCGSLVSCDPTGPVWPGEIQRPALGFAIEIYSAAGIPVKGEPGELVVTRAFPSIPIGFWGDVDGSRLRAAYFEHFPGVWQHGDWAEFTEHGGIVIHGRSDSTLNAGGVRIGSAELYRYLHGVAAIQESVVVAQRWDGDSRIVLFVKLAPGAVLDAALETALRHGIRSEVSPRHVPARIVAVTDIPVTVTAKVSEAAVHAALHGRQVPNRSALANPEALELFRPERLPELAS